jgi:uncharacterized membrane protein YraQ (UPF0718 family)
VAIEQILLVFISIIWEALPFVVLGVVIAGLLEEFVPQQALARIIPRNRALAIALGGILGLVFPMCECGIIVVMKRLLRKGLPLSVCVAYMLAGPIINIVVMLSTFVAFNPPLPKDYIFGGPYYVVALRVGLGYAVALLTALVVEWQSRAVGLQRLLHPSVLRGLKSADELENEANVKSTWGQSLGNIALTALNDFVDIMAFLILGAALAAGGRMILAQGNLTQLIQSNVAVSILLMMGIAVLFCLCSEADAFVAANFAPYWPPAAKLAFLVLGPMLDIKLYMMYTRVFRTRLILTLVLCVVTQVFLYTLLIHFVPTEQVLTALIALVIAALVICVAAVGLGRTAVPTQAQAKPTGEPASSTSITPLSR